ncbi:YhcH/YjgK/YiaL family protein [Undibacterium sp. LX40W]|uniref:YhcH/YjgK/YiaL family protein n=1 Tax=Undibacterium nitidum TaxID=2762298 RepID=A0A923HZC1_9BURK|nr:MULTISPECIES: YhcH/YjgK/YiaL family protein [Undibacterium]MBC3883016.1 YhcH/YjgK/YiaL family protein [Undibacterium nitidum]MBC3893297.1 YhcH/YjgK/YiaL family protein [Undibacterium sp. LX40W]
MILAHLDQASHLLPPEIQKAIDHLRLTDYLEKEPGRYEIEEGKMFALVQDPLTQYWDTGFPEFHQRHIDVQCLLQGEEIIGYLPANQDLIPTQDFLKERDIAFVATQENETKLHLTPRMFAVFYPGELHRPCKAATQPIRIKKVVIKIVQESPCVST